MADGYLIGAEYLFKSNAQRELGAIAKYSAQAAEAIEALEKSTAGASEALAAFSRVGSQVRTVLESILPMADRIAVAFEAIGANLGAMSTGAERAAGKYDASVESMGASTTAFAAEADTAFTGVIARLEGVTAAARTASVSLRTVNRTGAASAAGAGAAATAGGGAAMRFAGSAAGVGGLAALATLAIGTKQRANLQDSMIQTGLAMGEGKVLPDGYVQKNLLPIAMRMSMNTAQSVTDSMNLLRTMATSGLNNPRDMAQLAMPIAQFADTQFLGKNHVPFEQSAAQMAALSHMLNLRTAAQLAPFMNTEYKISNDMPDSLKTMQTQIKYFGSSFVQAGVAPEEVLKLAARADRLGYGRGKSGTGLNMILRNLRSPSSDKMYAAQQGLGLLDAHGNSRVIDQAGHFDPEALFAALNQTRHQFGKGRGREYGQLHERFANRGRVLERHRDCAGQGRDGDARPYSRSPDGSSAADVVVKPSVAAPGNELRNALGNPRRAADRAAYAFRLDAIERDWRGGNVSLDAPARIGRRDRRADSRGRSWCREARPGAGRPADLRTYCRA